MRPLWIAVLVVIGLGAALRGALPMLITHVLEGEVASRSPFVLEIGDLDLELIAGRARAEQASLRAESSTADTGPRLLLGALDLEIDLWALLDGRLHLRRVVLRDVALRAGQNEAGAIDWVALLEQVAADAPPEPEEASSEPFSLVLDHAALSPLAIELHHGPSGRVFHQTIDVTVDELRLGSAPATLPPDPAPASPTAPLPSSFEFEVRTRGDLGDLAITGSARPAPLEIRAKIVAQALDLVGISTLLDDPSLELGAGSLAVDLEVRADAADSEAAAPARFVVSATGSLAATEPRLSLPASGFAASLAAFDVEVGSLRLETGREQSLLDLSVKLGADGVETDLGEGASAGTSHFEADLEVDLRSGAGLELTLTGPLEARGTRLALPAAGISEATFETLSLQVDALDLTNQDEELQLSSKARLEAAGHRSKLALEAGDGLRAEGFGFDSLSVPIDGFDLAGPVVQLGRVALTEPEIDLRRTAVPGQPDPDGPVDTAAEAPASTLRFEMAGLELRGGRMRVVDETLSPAHTVKLAGIAVDLSRLRVGGEGDAGPALDTGEVRIASLGTQPLRATVSMQGGRITATLRGEEIDLAPFAPYAEQAGGYAITGRISAEVDAAVEGNTIEAPIGLVFQDLTLGSSRKDAPLAQLFQEIGLSLDMALALLRDPQGRVSLNIPVETSDTGTTVRLAPILRDALLQALTGALASPLKLAGATLATLRGGGDGTLARVPFAPGESAMPAEGAEELTGVARLLTNRPGVQVVLRARATRADQRALAARIGEPLAEGAEDVSAPLSPELRAALATLQRDRLAATRGSLIEHEDLDVRATQIREEAVSVPDTAPLEAGTAGLDIRLGDVASPVGAAPR